MIEEQKFTQISYQHISALIALVQNENVKMSCLNISDIGFPSDNCTFLVSNLSNL